MIEFRILGPLRVTLDGNPLPIGPRKHRILLASLLLRANRTVPIEELIDRLWQESPPAGARRTVQTYARRLRQELGSAGFLIQTCPEAYSIKIDPEQLDLARFLRLTDLAANARESGDPAGARGYLRQALAEWRGEPLADVPSIALAHAEVAHLVELRYRAVEQRIELDLKLGTVRELTSELRTLIAEQPLRERSWVLLMRSLCHGGRSAEALAVYHEAARLLGEELGVKPGQELRRLHAEILAGLTAAANPVESANVVRLHNLLTEALQVLTGLS